MIARLEKQPAFPSTITAPDLNEGERHVGTIISADGSKREHIILLPGEFEGKWQAAMDWAKKAGGDLFDRTEGALLFATMKDEFKPEAYWTREQHASDASYAWFQRFYYGDQYYYHIYSQCRARSVRRLIIK